MQPTQQQKWHNKTWLVILLCVLFFPIGIYALWKSEIIAMGWKIGITAIFSFIIIESLFNNNDSPSTLTTSKVEKENIAKTNNVNTSITNTNTTNENSTKESKSIETIDEENEDEGSSFNFFSYHIKRKYKCKCEDEAKEFHRVKYDEIVAKWGEPRKVEQSDEDVLREVRSVVWENPQLFGDKKTIMMEFSELTEYPHPVGRPNKVYCESDPYLANDGQMHTQWKGPY